LSKYKNLRETGMEQEENRKRTVVSKKKAYPDIDKVFVILSKINGGLILENILSDGTEKSYKSALQCMRYYRRGRSVPAKGRLEEIGFIPRKDPFCGNPKCL